MHYLIFILFGGFVTFLFTLYVLCHDDFILFRKNIDMEKIFNIAFLSVFAGLFFARLSFVILYFTPLYINPLAFLLFPYFPGLSLPGGMLGGTLALILILGGKKYPEGRIFDFFVIAFFTAALLCELALFGGLFVLSKKVPLMHLYQILMLFVLLVTTTMISRKHAIKEGSTGMLSIILFSLGSIAPLALDRPYEVTHIVKESSLWIVSCITAGIFFFKQDSIAGFVKGLRGK